MSIAVSSIIARMRSGGLDAQPNTDYYRDLEDLVPAIDSAQKWIVSVINKARSDNKATDEALRELTVCDIYRTSTQSRIIMESTIWTIDSVVPLCDTISNGTPTPAVPVSPFMSWKRTDLSFVRSYYSCYRKTVEEVSQNRLNPFSPGFMPTNITQADLVEGSQFNITFGYVPSYNYIYPTVAAGSYIEILPEIPNRLCAVFKVLNPTEITATNQSVQFPESLYDMLYEKALQFVSYVQGDDTTIWGVTENDVARLVKYIS